MPPRCRPALEKETQGAVVPPRHRPAFKVVVMVVMVGVANSTVVVDVASGGQDQTLLTAPPVNSRM